jgi:hypothetical protein
MSNDSTGSILAIRPRVMDTVGSGKSQVTPDAVSSRSRFHLPAWMIVSLTVLAFSSAVIGGITRNGLGGYDVLGTARIVVLAGAIVAAVAWILWAMVTVPRGPAIPREFQPWLALAMLGVVVKLLLPLEPALFFLIYICPRKAALWTLVALTLFLVVLRADRTALTGASAGALAGIVGFSICEGFCPILEASHVLLAHLAPALFLAAFGALFMLSLEFVVRRVRQH